MGVHFSLDSRGRARPRACVAGLDVRLLELPQHGQRVSNAPHAAPLPACAWKQPEARDRREIAAQLHQLARDLADEIRPSLRRSDGSAVPFALFGFSFGALIMYHVALTLQAEGHDPLLLGVAARVAPHALHMPTATFRWLQLCDDHELLTFASLHFGISLQANGERRGGSMGGWQGRILLRVRALCAHPFNPRNLPLSPHAARVAYSAHP